MKRLAFYIMTMAVLAVPQHGICGVALSCDSLWTDAMLQNGLPVQYKYLPLLLTGADTGFRNGQSAGAWALSVPVARHYGLRIDAVYDERHDVHLATQAAVSYLKDLETVYAGNPDRQLAVYLRSAGCCIDSLAEFRNRLAALSANAEFAPQAVWPANTWAVDTAFVSMDRNVRVTDFCALLQLDSVQFFRHNPCLSANAQTLRKGYRVYLPHDRKTMLGSLAAQFDSLALPDKPVVNQPTLPAPQPEYVVYRVRSGDTLSHIAARYHVGVSQLKRWNGLHSDMLQVGQRLKIYK